MTRVATTGGVCLLALGLCGCTSLFTAQAIESFTAEYAAGNLAGLQSSTSTAFQQRALRVSGAMESLQVLPLPREEGEITEVEEISPDEKLLTVVIGDGKDDQPQQTVKYRLKREAATKESRSRWVVDDVILTQSRGAGKPPLTKSVTEQMDVLLTVQEFLTHWKNGSREETLSVLHPELADRMSSLSPVHLAQITATMLDGLKDEKFRPEAKLLSTQATITLPRRGGKLRLDLDKLEAGDRRWVIRDVVLESSRAGDATTSVAHLAGCVGRAADFLNAYQAADLRGLEQSTSPGFYQNALRTADLTTVPLPVPQILASRYVLEEQDQRTDLLFTVGDNTYLISMTRDTAPVVILPEDRAATPGCRINEVTIYERGGAQIKPLSVVFTAQAVVEVFAEALATHDLALATQLSTPDFTRRVWSRVESAELMKSLSFDGIPAAEPRIVTTIFQGPVTEITVTQGTRALTYVLHAGGGRPQVDDIRYPSNNRSGSLKTSLEVLVPIHNFAWAWQQQNRKVLEQNSSDGVRRMVWMRTREIPQIAAPLDRYLTSGPPKIEELGSSRIVTLGTPEKGLVVRLAAEHGQLAIEDVHVFDPALTGGRIELVNAMRNWITEQERRPLPRRGSTKTAANVPVATTAERESLAVLPEQPATAPVTAPAPAAPSAVSPAKPAKPLLQQPIAIPGA